MADTRATPASDLNALSVERDAWTGPQLAAVGVVSGIGLLSALTQSVLIPILPSISTDLGSSTTDTEWLLTSTLLVAAVAVPVFGRLADLYGKRLMLIVSGSFLPIGSLICALSHNLTMMIVGRAVTGLSSAVLPLGISLVTVVLPKWRAATGVALISAMLGIGGSVGLPLAGYVAEHADYHVLFWIVTIGGTLSLIGTRVFLVEPPERAEGRFDVPGAVLLASALTALLLPLSLGSQWGWNSSRTIGLFLLAALLLVAFVLVELRLHSPLVDVAVNARPALALTNIASACVGFALFANFIGTSSYVQAPTWTGYGFGASVLVGGLCLLPGGIAMLALSPVSAKLTRRFGPKVTLCLGSAVVAFGFFIRIVFTAHLWQIVLGATICGAGTGIAYAAMPALIALAAPRSELAAANGLNALSRTIGSSVASAIGGTLLVSQLIHFDGITLPALSAYRILFAVCAGAAATGAVIALVIPRSDTVAE